MKKKAAFSIFLLFFSSLVYVSNASVYDDIIYNGNFNDGLDYWYLGGVGKYCNYSFIPEADYNILQINIFTEPERFWYVQLIQDYQIGVNEEDILLLTFNLKNPSNDVIVAIQDNGEPWYKYVWIEINQSSETMNYRIAFDGSICNWDAHEVELCFFFGENTGIFEISNISFKNLGTNVDIEELNADMVCNPFFGTQENTDDWREPALNRIEEIRKSALIVKCKDSNGNALSGVKVHINQTKSHFLFGTAVNADYFGGDEYNPTYVKKVEELFNVITIEDHLKWKFMEWAHPAVDYVFEWAEERNIPVHGHCLFWPSYKHCPRWLQGLPPDKVYESVISHVENYTQEFKGKVIHWDVINEAITCNEIWQECGIELLVDCYITAKENDPDALLMYNDYDLLSNHPEKQEQVINLVNELKGMGAPVEGLGIQGHLWVGELPTPANALKNLDRMATLGLPIYITELDIGTAEHWDFHAEYFTDLMTALFSHPSVKGIIQWGFWEGSHWRPDTALYNLDWTPRPAGLAYENLIFNEWRTDVILYTNVTGEVYHNCFHGDYEVTASYENCTIIDTISVLPGSNASLLITFVTENEAPNKPTRPSGPITGEVGKEYAYTTSTTDPDGDKVYYKWDWGDGSYSNWLGPYNSGEICEASHIWEEKGNYAIKVISKDVHNVTSEWSDSLLISMPKQAMNPLFLQLLERLVKQFPILRQIFSFFQS
ncbi:MAG: hypothetical protein FE048_01870 [Thermoplasmata archaeon]|nr:MAG: hypothetical protein FE048_01870 [Thermoplasmata archaeon]